MLRAPAIIIPFRYAAGCVNVNVMNINIFREKNDKKNACRGDSGSIKQMV